MTAFTLISSHEVRPDRFTVPAVKEAPTAWDRLQMGYARRLREFTRPKGSRLGKIPRSLEDLLAHPLWKGSTVKRFEVTHVAAWAWGPLPYARTLQMSGLTWDQRRCVEGPAEGQKVCGGWEITHPSGARAFWYGPEKAPPPKRRKDR